MPLDPQIQAMRDQRERDNVQPLYTLSLEQARAADLASIRASGGEPEPVREVAGLTIPGPGGELPLRLYRPAGDRPLPVLLYFFGGGWVLGTIDTADGVSRTLANSSGALVAVVGYRLAPEHPFPAAIDDCYAALRWVSEHAAEIGADPSRLAVGGDSAGGNLAAAVALRARADGPALAGQILIYPNTDQLADDESMRTADDPFLFNRHSVAWYRQYYLTDPGDAANPLASPLRAQSLAGLPPALVITAEYDPLRDQGEAYARRMTEAGVLVELSRYPGMAHGFFTMSGTVDASRAAIAQVASRLRTWLGPAAPPAPTAPGAPRSNADLRALRHHRATAKAAGGILDLVMPMRVGGDGPILFFAHPMIGLSWCYLALVPHIDARYPLYGLQARGMRRPEPLPVSMVEMARDYADQIRTVQPAGPYHLFGWSLGGNIAFAIAEELEGRGERVGLLVILDSDMSAIDLIAPSNEPWMVYNMVLAQFGYLPVLTPADSDPEARMLELVRQRPGLGMADWPDQRVRALQRVIRNNVVVGGTHQPGRVHCPLLFISATRDSRELAEKVKTWRLFVDGPIETFEVDCDHRDMMLPEPVVQIGPALTQRLARVAAAQAAPIV